MAWPTIFFCVKPSSISEERDSDGRLRQLNLINSAHKLKPPMYDHLCEERYISRSTTATLANCTSLMISTHPAWSSPLRCRSKNPLSNITSSKLTQIQRKSKRYITQTLSERKKKHNIYTIKWNYSTSTSHLKRHSSSRRRHVTSFLAPHRNTRRWTSIKRSISYPPYPTRSMSASWLLSR